MNLYSCGEARGREEGEKHFKTLTKYLLRDGRIDALEKATEDEEYKNQLYEEYGI